MEQKDVRALLEDVKNGNLSVEDAVVKLKMEPFQELGFAKIDMHRGLRQGTAEVIYGAGKTPEQIRDISKALLAGGQERVLITRMSKEAAQLVAEALPLSYHELGRIGIIGGIPEPDGDGSVMVATGGTSDIPVAEEAALTAEMLGNRVVRLYDVGVAGLHRLLAHTEEIMRARAIVAIAVPQNGTLPGMATSLLIWSILTHQKKYGGSSPMMILIPGAISTLNGLLKSVMS